MKKVLPVLFIILFGGGILGYIYYNYSFNTIAHNKLLKNHLDRELVIDTFETGLDDQLPFSSKYYFRGENPNNYFVINNNCFRIINISQNNALKIMHIGTTNDNTCQNVLDNSKLIQWDEQNNNWETSSLLNNLNKWLEEVNLHNSDYILKNVTWYIGGVQYFAGSSLTKNIIFERESDLEEATTYMGAVGLINVSDYMKACEKLCTSGAFADEGKCSVDNYLNIKNNMWTINKTYNTTEHVWAIENGIMQSKLNYNVNFNAYPVIYLKSDLIFKGEGSQQIPYMINDN